MIQLEMYRIAMTVNMPNMNNDEAVTLVYLVDILE